MPRIPEAAKPLAEILDELTAPAAAALAHDEGDGRVRCFACAHRCLVLPGQRGICQVRINREGQLRVPFGYVGALQCDPTEKKPFFHVLPGSSALTFGMLGCDLHCPYCFAPGLRVATTAGMRRIEDLWDEAQAEPTGPDERRRPRAFLAAISHDGSERLVRSIFRHPYRAELVRIKPRLLPAFEATPDHPVLATVSPGVEPPRIVPAGALTYAHYLAVPRRHHFSQPVTYETRALLARHLGSVRVRRHVGTSTAREIMLATEAGLTSALIAKRTGLRPDHVRHVRSRLARRGGDTGALEMRPEILILEDRRIRFGQERRPGIPALLPLNREFAELLGYYCAEGTVMKLRGRPNAQGVVFSFGPEERALAERTQWLLRRVFRIEATVAGRPTTITVTGYKTSAAATLRELCGTGAAQKHVPEALHRVERAPAQAFLDAYVRGDGHRYASGKVLATTVSQQLAWDIAWLALRLGHLSGLYVTQRNAVQEILGRKVRSQPYQYSIVWYERRPSRTLYREDEHFYYVPIRNIERRPYDGPVYNLEVEQTHTYLANLFVVGNCQNWLTSQALRDERALVPPQLTSPEELADLGVELRASMLASSYNEPLITSEWAAAVMTEGRKRGLVTAYVSNGNATPQVLDFLRPLIDCYKVDLKAMDDRAYRELGAKLENVLATIEGLKARGFWVEIVTLLVPGLNDTEEQVRAAARFLASVDPLIPWHVTAFHPDYKMTDRDWTPAQTLVWAAGIGEEEGLKYVYAGNLPGRVGRYEDTRCHACGATLIRRFGYEILEDRVTSNAGSCRECGTRIPGIWQRPEARA